MKSNNMEEKLKAQHLDKGINKRIYNLKNRMDPVQNFSSQNNHQKYSTTTKN
uniref:Uncharacterized protein n=1 Tax=Rhizophora mucronata TaxID=61149 RepID=A0A2P2QJ49_RHIMU